METPLSPFTFEPKPDWFEQYKYYALAGLLLIFGVGLYLILTPPSAELAKDPDAKLAGANNPTIASAAANTDTGGQIVIDIAGGIKQAGVYWLNTGSIIEDAIKAAGGFSAAADLTAVGQNINRAQELTNHGKVYIPKIGDNKIVYTAPAASSSSNTPPANPASSLININTADNAELDLLPGIGPVLSQRIIDYRLQHDGFQSIDDLKQVPGINDSRFGQIKDLVTI